MSKEDIITEQRYKTAETIGKIFGSIFGVKSDFIKMPFTNLGWKLIVIMSENDIITQLSIHFWSLKGIDITTITNSKLSI